MERCSAYHCIPSTASLPWRQQQSSRTAAARVVPGAVRVVMAHEVGNDCSCCVSSRWPVFTPLALTTTTRPAPATAFCSCSPCHAPCCSCQMERRMGRISDPLRLAVARQILQRGLSTNPDSGCLAQVGGKPACSSSWLHSQRGCHLRRAASCIVCCLHCA